MAQVNNRVVKELLKDYGRTYADEAGITLRDTPAPLFQLLVMSLMLSARIAADKAVSATASLFKSGLTTPKKMADASWQERVDAITWSGYKRYDERTATSLGKTAETVLEKYDGDLRKLRDDAHHDVGQLHGKLQTFNGIGKVGANIFLREVQTVWDEVYPFADDAVLKTAGKLSLPTETEKLSKVCRRKDLAPLTAALTRVKLNKKETEIKQAVKR